MQNKSKKIAVLLATFNGERFLTDQLDSILKQKDVLIDLYISDDCSNDNTKKNIESYANKTPNIFFINHKRIGGPSKNFYYLISQIDISRYDFVALCDQDDIWPQRGVPTSNQFIAEQIKAIIPQLNDKNTGIYHLVPDGSCSWHEFAKQIIGQTKPQFDLNNLNAISTHEFPTKTKRPANSVLSNIKIKQTFNLQFNDWSQELLKIIHG